jgi:hypothetical protein
MTRSKPEDSDGKNYGSSGFACVCPGLEGEAQFEPLEVVRVEVAHELIQRFLVEDEQPSDVRGAVTIARTSISATTAVVSHANVSHSFQSQRSQSTRADQLLRV